MSETETMPTMVGEWRHDGDPVKRAMYWLVARSWTDADDFEECQATAKALWPLREQRATGVRKER